MNVTKKSFRLDVRKKFFSGIGLDEWNALNEKIIQVNRWLV